MTEAFTVVGHEGVTTGAGSGAVELGATGVLSAPEAVAGEVAGETSVAGGEATSGAPDEAGCDAEGRAGEAEEPSDIRAADDTAGTGAVWEVLEHPTREADTAVATRRAARVPRVFFTYMDMMVSALGSEARNAPNVVVCTLRQ